VEETLSMIFFQSGPIGNAQEASGTAIAASKAAGTAKAARQGGEEGEGIFFIFLSTPKNPPNKRPIVFDISMPLFLYIEAVPKFSLDKL
jgi:hypothetical protein